MRRFVGSRSVMLAGYEVGEKMLGFSSAGLDPAEENASIHDMETTSAKPTHALLTTATDRIRVRVIEWNASADTYTVMTADLRDVGRTIADVPRAALVAEGGE